MSVNECDDVRMYSSSHSYEVGNGRRFSEYDVEYCNFIPMFYRALYYDVQELKTRCKDLLKMCDDFRAIYYQHGIAIKVSNYEYVFHHN